MAGAGVRHFKVFKHHLCARDALGCNPNSNLFGNGLAQCDRSQREFSIGNDGQQRSSGSTKENPMT